MRCMHRSRDLCIDHVMYAQIMWCMDRSDNATNYLWTVMSTMAYGHNVMSTWQAAWCKCTDLPTTWSEEQTWYTHADLDLKFTYTATFLKWLKVKTVQRGDKEEGPLLKWTQMKLNFSCPKGFPKAKSLKCWERVARLFIYNKLSTLGQAHFQKYSDLSDLDLKVRSIKSTHPSNASGHLLSQGWSATRKTRRKHSPCWSNSNSREEECCCEKEGLSCRCGQSCVVHWW